MNSDEAVEAAAKLLWYSDSTLIDTERPDWADAVTNRIWAALVEATRNTARELLEAAAPFIAAQALEAAVAAFPLETIVAPDNAVVWMMRRAEELRTGNSHRSQP